MPLFNTTNLAPACPVLVKSRRNVTCVTPWTILKDFCVSRTLRNRCETSKLSTRNAPFCPGDVSGVLRETGVCTSNNAETMPNQVFRPTWRAADARGARRCGLAGMAHWPGRLKTRECSAHRRSKRGLTPFLRHSCGNSENHWEKGSDPIYRWRRRPESNRRTRLCRPLHNHFATPPPVPPGGANKHGTNKKGKS